MYLQFYELDKKPFQINVDPLFLWMGESHREALAILQYGVIDNRGFIMLTGDVGTGKTTLVNALINSLDPNVIVANITNPSLKLTDFLNHLGAEFGIGQDFSGKGDFLFALEAFLEKCHLEGKQVLIIIDEAHRIERSILEEIRLLSNIEMQKSKLLNIFLVGQDELHDILDRHENRALRQRITLQYHLEPLSARDTDAYIKHRLKVAGTRRTIFTAQSAKEIFDFSEGYPRVINIICDHAMLSSYVKKKKTIDTNEIIECAKDLRLKRKSAHSAAPKPPRPAGKRTNSRTHPGRHRLAYVVAAIFIILLLGFLFFPGGRGVLSFRSPFGVPADSGTPSRQDVRAPETQPPAAAEDKGDETPGSLLPSAEEVAGDEAPGSLLPSAAEVAGNETPESRESGGTESREAERPESPNADDSTPDLSSILSSLPTIPDSEKRYSLVFEFDSDRIATRGYERLTKTATLMRENPYITATVTGHTDNTGGTDYNLQLSKHRADIVRDYLVGLGVAPERITSVGKGSQEPVADNGSEGGRRMNRRVEVALNPS